MAQSLVIEELKKISKSAFWLEFWWRFRFWCQNLAYMKNGYYTIDKLCEKLKKSKKLPLLGAAPLVLSSAQLNEKFLSDALASLGTDASLRSGQIHLIERHYCLHMLKVLRSAQQTDFSGQIMSYASLHSLYMTSSLRSGPTPCCAWGRSISLKGTTVSICLKF